MVEEFYTTKVLPHSINFYLPRTEGYMDVVKEIASKYGSMSLIEFDGYFEGKFEPEKYTRLEVHAEIMEEQQIIEYANKIRKRLKQNSLGLEVDNKMILVVKRWKSQLNAECLLSLADYVRVREQFQSFELSRPKNENSEEKSNLI